MAGNQLPEGMEDYNGRFFLSLAQDLEDGISRDLWYDAHGYEDADAERMIQQTKDAMALAATILRDLVQYVRY